jgi:hypothetical protein
MNATIYTSHEQTEQGLLIHAVQALLVISDGTLTIEARENEPGHHSFNAHHRFDKSQWKHFSVSA